MNHEYVEQNEVVDLYLMGRLGPDEAAAFEEHYLSCDGCLEQLELAEGFQAGLKRVAAEDAVKLEVARRVGFAAWLARAARSPRAGLLAAALIAAVVVPSTLLYRQLDAERDRVGALAAELDAARAPQGALVVPLSPERSAGGAPSVRLRLPATPGWIVVSLELERPEHGEYRVTLLGPGGETVWRGDGLVPDPLDALSISLHSATLADGDYQLVAEGLAPGGDPVGAGRFAFRVTPSFDRGGEP